MSFGEKYLKYKNKYSKLKNQIGGMFLVGDRVRVRGNKNIVVENRLERQNYSEVEGNIVKRDVAPNGMDIYTVATEFGNALEINSHVHTITKLNTNLGRQAQRFAFAHAAAPPNPPTVGFNMAPPPHPHQPQPKYHQYEVNSWVEVDGTPIKKGVIIKASEYNFDIPVYDIRIVNIDQTDDIILEKVSEFTIIKKLDSIAELIRLQQIRKLIDEAKERKKMDVAMQLAATRFGQSDVQPLEQDVLSQYAEFLTPTERSSYGQQAVPSYGQQAVPSYGQSVVQPLEQDVLSQYAEFGQSATPLKNSRRAEAGRQLAETRTRKARVFRNDGKATFIQLRVEPIESSTFISSSVLLNGTIVDILDSYQLYPGWEYVRFSPNRDTDIRGWVRKIYLQNQ